MDLLKNGRTTKQYADESKRRFIEEPAKLKLLIVVSKLLTGIDAPSCTYIYLEARLKVKVAAYFLQRMKTKWGGCNPQAGNIRLNTELVKKPKDLLEYVLVHEMAHLLEPHHRGSFVAVMDAHYPTWREARAELNALPLGAQTW